METVEQSWVGKRLASHQHCSRRWFILCWLGGACNSTELRPGHMGTKLLVSHNTQQFHSFTGFPRQMSKVDRKPFPRELSPGL
ncbi:hypothetical protein RRG08_055330 [Elysia crispata]|uniref:Uncharacterized protein n=1 Tax=Elysia crispata TaxID=231223 RepID=A0AAE1AQM5_9GAST|nr:hypothetical protein RRG08_055330 [Elysia crispata]